VAKKHKHEEHVNHERWLVSFADMMTLLFALFVVLYAMSVVDLDKASLIKKSIRFYFHIEGDGATQTEGNFSDGAGSDLLDGVDLVTAQAGGMKEFLKDLDAYQESNGRSLEVVINDDSISVAAPLTEFFVEGEVATLRSGAYDMLADLCTKSMEFTSEIRVIIEYDFAPFPTPKGIIQSDDAVAMRLNKLGRMLVALPRIESSAVRREYYEFPESRTPRRALGWERRAIMRLVFSTSSGG